MSISYASEQLTVVLHAAQYLSNLSPNQDPWAELAEVLTSFFRCDLVLIVKPDLAGDPQLMHEFTRGVPAGEILRQTLDEVRMVFETGFLGTQMIADPACALAILPLPRDRRPPAVAIAGQVGAGQFSKEDLEILLAFAGLFGNVLARVETERELRAYQQNLEMLIAERTMELKQTNARLVQEMFDHRRSEEERRRVEADLLQAQKMESLGRLAGGVAHDMNNVLAAILALASVNSRNMTPADPLHNDLHTIEEAAIRGGKMVQTLLDFARKGAIEERDLDLNILLNAEVKLLAQKTNIAGVQLELDLETYLRPIQGNDDALSHAFMNLCVNAVDAMPDSGTLTLRTRNVDNNWVEVMVEDTGVGMSKEVLEKAFEPFFTTKPAGKGTGLGLAMVYNTIKAHKGQVELQSEPGNGTRVRIQFPAKMSMGQVPEPIPEPRAEPKMGPMKILVVDDDDLVLRSTRLMVSALGLTAVTASDGEEALAKIEEGFRPDVVILDLNMPGLGGAGTLRHLRSICPDIPVLLATGRADDFAMDLIRNHPKVTLLAKPFSYGDLKKKMALIVRKGL